MKEIQIGDRVKINDGSRYQDYIAVVDHIGEGYAWVAGGILLNAHRIALDDLTLYEGV